MRLFLVLIMVLQLVGCARKELLHVDSDQPASSTAMFDWSSLGSYVYRIDRLQSGKRTAVLGLEEYCGESYRDYSPRFGRTRLLPGDYEYYYSLTHFSGSQRFSVKAGHRYVVREENYFETSGASTYPCGYPMITDIWVFDETTWKAVSGVNKHLSCRRMPVIAHVCGVIWEIRAAEEQAAKRESRAMQGDREAAFLLAIEFENPDYLRAFAERGDTEAAIALAKHYGELGPLEELAKQGDAEAAYETWLQHSAPERLGESWRWLCTAANHGSARALAEIGYWHRSDIWTDFNAHSARQEVYFGADPRELLKKHGVRSDDIRAYMWYSLAAQHDSRYRKHRDRIFSNQLADDEIAQAEEMARDWQPDGCS